MIPALDWFKLLQKDREFEFNNNEVLRRQESKHVKSRLEIVINITKLAKLEANLVSIKKV